MPRVYTSSITQAAVLGSRTLATPASPRLPVQCTCWAEYFRFPGEVRRYLGTGRQSGYAHRSCGERRDVQCRALQVT